MKIKILVAPALIVFAIWMIIWVLYPAYGDLQNYRQKLSEAQTRLEDIKEKNEKVERLSRDLSQSAETQDILLRYVPSSQKEEEIVDNLNYLASREGLSVYRISVEDKKTNQSSAVATKTVAPPAPGTLSASEPSSEGVSVVSEVSRGASPKDMEVKIGLTGTYDKIRAFFNKLAALRRFNNVGSAKITEEIDPEKEESFAGILKVETSVAFNYLEKVTSVTNVNDEVFYRDTFDTSVIDGIKNNMSTGMVDLELGSKGRENPFIPN